MGVQVELFNAWTIIFLDKFLLFFTILQFEILEQTEVNFQKEAVL